MLLSWYFFLNWIASINKWAGLNVYLLDLAFCIHRCFIPAQSHIFPPEQYARVEKYENACGSALYAKNCLPRVTRQPWMQGRVPFILAPWPFPLKEKRCLVAPGLHAWGFLQGGVDGKKGHGPCHDQASPNLLMSSQSVSGKQQVPSVPVVIPEAWPCTKEHIGMGSSARPSASRDDGATLQTKACGTTGLGELMLIMSNAGMSLWTCLP